MEEQALMSNSSHDSDSDIKNQVLSDFLFHRKQAIQLKNMGQFSLGLNELTTILSGTPLSPESYDQADEIIKEIDQINWEVKSNARPAHTRARRQYERERYRQARALELFDGVLRRITLLLQNEGYFDIFLGKYRSGIIPISGLDAVTNKPSDEALPERLKEDME